MQTALLPIVDCPADPRECGRAHGEVLRAAIADKIGRWHDAIGEAYGIPAATFLPRFLAETDFRGTITRHTPDLAEEVAGIAEGAAISHDAAYALQLLDEEWWFGSAGGDGHCSSLAVAPQAGRPTIVAQTMDLPRWHDGAQALLRIRRQDGSDTLVFTSAGMIGLMGVSARGLGICVNTLSQLAVSRTGLPVAFVMRGALARSDVAAAADFLRKVPHASGQNYQLGDRTRIATLECSAGGAAEIDIADGRSLHTNHPLASRDIRSGISPEGSADSRGRLDSLRADLPSRVAADVDGVKRALSACRAGGEVSITRAGDASPIESMTVGSVIYEIGNDVVLSVCAGPPGTEAWREITPVPA